MSNVLPKSVDNMDASVLARKPCKDKKKSVSCLLCSSMLLVVGSGAALLASMIVALVANCVLQVPSILEPLPWHTKLWILAPYYEQLLETLRGERIIWPAEELHRIYAQALMDSGLYPDEDALFARRELQDMQPVKEISFTDPDWKKTFAEVYQSWQTAPEPIVIRNITALDKEHFWGVPSWDLDFFLKVYDGVHIPVFQSDKNMKSAVPMLFKDYVGRMLDAILDESKNPGKAACIDDTTAKEFQKGFDGDYIFEMMDKSWSAKFMSFLNNWGPVYCLFVSNSLVYTRMHASSASTSFMQIRGRKHWIFANPRESPLLLPCPHQDNTAFNTEPNIYKPDFEKYPLLSQVPLFETTLNPGYLLLFPSMWWHAVKNLDTPSLGLDYPIFDIGGALRRNPLLELGMLLNGNVALKAWKAWRAGEVGGLRRAFYDNYMSQTMVGAGREKK